MAKAKVRYQPSELAVGGGQRHFGHPPGLPLPRLHKLSIAWVLPCLDTHEAPRALEGRIDRYGRHNILGIVIDPALARPREVLIVRHKDPPLLQSTL